MILNNQEDDPDGHPGAFSGLFRKGQLMSGTGYLEKRLEEGQ